MAKSATKDMTVGSPMKLILSFSMPLLIGFISAVLQCGRYLYCGKNAGNECSCGCWRNRKH